MPVTQSTLPPWWHALHSLCPLLTMLLFNLLSECRTPKGWLLAAFQHFPLLPTPRTGRSQTHHLSLQVWIMLPCFFYSTYSSSHASPEAPNDKNCMYKHSALRVTWAAQRLQPPTARCTGRCPLQSSGLPGHNHPCLWASIAERCPEQSQSSCPGSPQHVVMPTAMACKNLSSWAVM